MKQIFRLFMFILILCFAMPLSAQNDSGDTCTIDLTDALRELKDAQAEAEQDNLTSAVQLMESAQAQIADMLAGCENLIIDLPQIVEVHLSNPTTVMTISYPEDWILQNEANFVYVAESQDTLDFVIATPEGFDNLPLGTLVMTISAVDPAMLQAMLLDGQPNDPVALLERTLETGDTTGIAYEGVREETLNGRPAATLIATSTIEGENGRGFVVIVAVNNTLVSFAATTAMDETAFDDTIRTMAGAIDVTFPVEEENTEETTTTDTSTATLAQSIASADSNGGVLTIGYPEGWVAQEFNGSITVGNSAEIFTSNASTIISGQVIGSVLALPSEMLSLLGLGENPPVADVLVNFMETTLNEDPNVQFDVGAPQTFTVNSKTVVMQTGTATDANGTSDVAFLIIDSETTYLLLSFIAAEGEIAMYDAQIRAIAGSVEFGTPEVQD